MRLARFLALAAALSIGFHFASAERNVQPSRRAAAQTFRRQDSRCVILKGPRIVMDDVVDHVDVKTGMHARDVAERIRQEEPRRAVIGVLIFLSRHQNHRRRKVIDDLRKLL